MQGKYRTRASVLGMAVLIALSNTVYAYIGPHALKQAKSDNPTPAAGCAAAVATASLELNNVRTLIEGTGGSMFQDRAINRAAYEVPVARNESDPKFYSIYAGALWMGGQDVNGQIKLAAVTFRASGNDFWPGPLSTTTAEIDAETCDEYDRFFGISRTMVNTFVGWNIAKEEGTEDELYPGYQIPDEILEWPGNGDASKNEREVLAPFFDVDGDGIYDPEGDGDYPKYDLLGEVDCRVTRDVRLFGDTTIWFVFNDKGNVHSETGSSSIGLEIRGQAFAFATNDEVNDMTFYNYEIINQSSFTLTETYFAQWLDPDLGFPGDDYVGCDAERGLGYCYNGEITDNSTSGSFNAYSGTPPAVGVDFFEGPYQDDDWELNADGSFKLDAAGNRIALDNPLTTIVQDALDSAGIPYDGLGIGYGDGVGNNERYGMRKFVYYVIGEEDPITTLDYYRYMQGIWKDGARMTWGENARNGTIPADLMFPGSSDPLFWSTRGEDPGTGEWTEDIAGNDPGDRRFLQSAGPFTLEPGAVNDITVGIVWAKATAGDNLASIEDLKVADDKAQTLFDNCFKIVEGPDAPDITFQELDRELILYLSNRPISNNYNESYEELDKSIIVPDTIDGVGLTDEQKDSLSTYTFQGYQIFQVKNSSVSVTELYDPELSRLVAQVDIKDGVTQLVNYTFDDNLQANVPQEMVVGEDLGIQHSFRITEDRFTTTSDRRLVNHKTYYFIAIAYGYNNFKTYNPLDPTALDGQTKPYLSSRKSGGGSGIISYAAIPHNPTPESNGTTINARYGDMPLITRIEGQGNGGNNLELTAASEAEIVANGFTDYPTYKQGHGPIEVKVIDPLAVKTGTYTVRFQDTTGGDLDDAYWILTTPEGDQINSDQTIAVENEQLVLDEGISITIKQVLNPGSIRQTSEVPTPEMDRQDGSGVLTSAIEYVDSLRTWLTGISDSDGESDYNWIRSGTTEFDPEEQTGYDDYFYFDGPIVLGGQPITNFIDPSGDFERIINGTWAPYRLIGSANFNESSTGQLIRDAVAFEGQSGDAYKDSDLNSTPSVDIVFTNDKSKWSRCVVFEARNDVALAEGGAAHLLPREAPSVDKSGRKAGDSGYNSAEGDLVSTTGMGWFPGYAIDLETGKRLNIAFAEDSWLNAQNGRDMIWNPTSLVAQGFGSDAIKWGGKHYVYVFKEETAGSQYFPGYDDFETLYNEIVKPQVFFAERALSTCGWAGIPLLAPGYSLGEVNASTGLFELNFETEARVKLRVEKPYDRYPTASTVNSELPMYSFEMEGLEVEVNSVVGQDSTLELINVVPNPYYAYSEYESDKLDNRIKITNLPEECIVSIYNVGGTLIRRFNKSDPLTSLDWDLKNQANIPVAGGVYLIHVDVPGVGERVLKWFGVMKPTDLQGL